MFWSLCWKNVADWLFILLQHDTYFVCLVSGERPLQWTISIYVQNILLKMYSHLQLLI